MNFAALGPIAALITAITGAIVALVAAKNAREAKSTAAATAAAKQTFEEKSLAITTLEKAVDAMGEMVDRATARAEACETREAKLQDRINRLEQATGLA